jgi:TM2 domain-containing membrane protein YozV
MCCCGAESVDSGSLHCGQRLAKPGLPGLSSNSSEQTTQVLIGNAIGINGNGSSPAKKEAGTSKGELGPAWKDAGTPVPDRKSQIVNGPAPVRYSQKGMGTTPNKIAADQKQSSQALVYLPLIAGWLVPGAGHFLLHKWGRGALLSASILGMFATGLAMQGKLYAGAHDILDILGLAGDLGNGLLYVVSQVLGLGADQVRVTTADYGTRFIVVAGLLNVIAAVDAHNLRTGRKA